MCLLNKSWQHDVFMAEIKPNESDFSYVCATLLLSLTFSLSLTRRKKLKPHRTWCLVRYFSRQNLPWTVTSRYSSDYTFQSEPWTQFYCIWNLYDALRMSSSMLTWHGLSLALWEAKLLFVRKSLSCWGIVLSPKLRVPSRAIYIRCVDFSITTALGHPIHKS